MARSGGTLVSSANCGSILVTPLDEYAGRFVEGIIATGRTPKPGTAMQLVPTTALIGGRHTWTEYNRDATGDRPAGPIIILLEDRYQGKTPDTAYAAGDRAFGYVPREGDELNLLFGNVSGTGDDIAAGDIAIIEDATGKFIKTASTPETEVAQFLEPYTDPAADKLLWAAWSGH